MRSVLSNWIQPSKNPPPFWIHLLQSNVIYYFMKHWGQFGTYCFASGSRLPLREWRMSSSPLPPAACAAPHPALSTSRVSSAASVGCSDPSPHRCLLASSIPYLVLAATEQHRLSYRGCLTSFRDKSSFVLLAAGVTTQGATAPTPLAAHH